MRENFPFTALRKIQQPGGLLYPYGPGDGLPAEAVRDWGLVVGEDVMPTNTKSVPRPADDADRADWEAFAIGQGMTVEDAREATMRDLRAVPDPDPEQPAEALPDPLHPARPDDGAVKAEWVAWAVSQGADEEWANAKGTTKADLQAYEPDATATQPTDEVAAAANEQANG